MNIIFVLLPISVLLALVFLVAYFWSLKWGQFDDLDTPALRMLFDETEEIEEKTILSEALEKPPGRGRADPKVEP